MSEFFIIETDMARTPYGLILPNKHGTALAVVGTLLPDELAREKIEPMGGEIGQGQACVLVDVGLFLHAAKDVLQERRTHGS